MKKLLVLLLAMMLVCSMVFSLASCGWWGSDDDDTDDTDTPSDDTPGDDTPGDDVGSDDTDVDYDPTTGGMGIELPIIPVPSTPNTTAEEETEGEPEA